MVLFLTLGFLLASASSLCVFGYNITQFLPQSFLFDWNLPGQNLPVPTTAQCDTIHITWGRSSAQGPNPTAPYYLQIYTSAFIVPFLIDAGSGLDYNWTVPFVPGTQYQICMFDSNGNTGGCQAVYTVYPAFNTTLQDPPTCTNMTYPASSSVLNVTGIVDNGPLSQYGWIDQCTDLSLTPNNGQPPYTMTVAPALHPPYNITSQTQGPINWTVSLSWASPFFVSLVDSTGMIWSNGPLHSGGNGPPDCLSLSKPSNSSSKSVAPAVTIGASVGSFVLGGLLGVIAALAILHNRRADNHGGQPASGNNSPIQAQNMFSFGEVEPFTMSNDVRSGSSLPLPSSLAQPSYGESRTSQAESSSGQQRSNVYVVHHDGGRAPVTVYADGAHVVELPPTYDPQHTFNEPPQPLTANEPLQPQRRVAGQVPRKERKAKSKASS